MKNYKEILEGVINIINSTEKSDIGFANICTYIGQNCPELKESEDEKVRKGLIAIITDFDSLYLQENYSLSREDTIDWLEKQGGQKHAAWSEEDELNLSEALHHIRMYNLAGKADKLDKWLKSLKDRVQPKQKWIEEDERLFQIIIDILDKEEHKGHLSHTDLIDCVRKLKSLRPQNRCTYNPYKEVVESIAEMCEKYEDANLDSLKDFYSNVKVKCKDAKEYDSLFPQFTWKPSDAQMVVLNDIIINGHLSNANERILKGLQEQLKKLTK